MNFEEQKSRFDIHEYEVGEDDSRLDPEAPVKSPEKEYVLETQRERKRRLRGKKKKEEDYKGLFFVAACCFGVGGFFLFGHLASIFIGTGVGFLLMVDPIYEKIMSAFKS